MDNKTTIIGLERFDLVDNAEQYKIERISVPEADAILGLPYKCLDHGFVRFIDYMGNDSRVVQAARTSYSKGTKTIREDEGLINYLVRNEHTSPIEMVEFLFHAKMPIFVARQWIRHRTASVNEMSARYSILENEFYIPEDAQICYQSKDNKQGRSGQMVEVDIRNVKHLMKKVFDESHEIYEILIDMGLARELARDVLPTSIYTQWYWKIDLKNLLHFLKLRLDGHAQYEIRVYGEVISEMVRLVTPMVYNAFKKHILLAKKFSSDDVEILRKIWKELAENREPYIEEELIDELGRMLK